MTKIASYQLWKFWIGRQIFRVTAIATLPTYQNLSLVVMQVTIFTLTFLIVLSLHCFVGIFGNKLSMYMSRLSGWLSSKPSKLPEMPEWLPSSTPREGPWARLSGMDCVPTCPHANFNIWTSQVRCPCCTRNGRLLLFPARAHTRTNYIFVHFYTIPVSLSAKNSCYVP